jgi:hypothetical protein
MAFLAITSDRETYHADRLAADHVIEVAPIRPFDLTLTQREAAEWTP